MKKVSTGLREKFERHLWSLGLLLIGWGGFFVVLFGRMLRVTERGIEVGHAYVWSDWALHIGMARIFELQPPSLWFDHHPIFAHGKFTYGFLTNFISGMLLRAGASLEAAFIGTSIFFSLILLIGLYGFLTCLTRTRWAAVLAVSIFFLSSGLGFWGFLQDFVAHPSASLLINPLREYSRLEQMTWLQGNVITGLLLPQRAFLLGLALASWSLWGLVSGMQRSDFDQMSRFVLIGAGLLAGVLPITHMHSFMVLAFIGLVLLTDRRRWQRLVWYGVPAASLGGILYFLFIAGGVSGDFFQINWWWSSDGFIEWLKFWGWAWGLMLPLYVIGLFRWYRVHGFDWRWRLFLGFGLIFLIANVIQFQPVEWDNSKLFFWAYLGMAGLVSWWLAQVWRAGWWQRIMVGGLILILSATGVLEVILLQRIDQHTYTLLTEDELVFADEVARVVPADGIIASAPQHNHPVAVWSGRQILLGYTAWAWNFGFEYGQRERLLEWFYEDPISFVSNMRQLDVQYVVVGPAEQRRYSVAEKEFEEIFSRVVWVGEYRLFAL